LEHHGREARLLQQARVLRRLLGDLRHHEPRPGGARQGRQVQHRDQPRRRGQARRSVAWRGGGRLGHRGGIGPGRRGTHGRRALRWATVRRLMPTAVAAPFVTLAGPPGVAVHLHRTTAFKTVLLQALFEAPLDEGSSARALLADLLTRATRRLPSLAALAARCDELYG